MNTQTNELRAVNAWLDTAHRDYRSAAEFGALALSLIGLGAPTELVCRTQQAGLRAVDQHARCMEIVGALGGPKMTAHAATTPALTAADSGFAGTAVSAFQHGVVGHGQAVNCLRRSIKNAAPPIADHIAELLVDHQLQMATARDVVAWCVEASPSSIVEVHNAARRLPPTAPERQHMPGSSPSNNAAHAGLCDPSAHQDSWTETVLESTWWLATALN